MNLLKRLFGYSSKQTGILKTSEVFKVSGVPNHTFVERISLNERIEEFFIGKDAALLFLGYSKSGKTVYRKKHLEKKGMNIVTFRCNNRSTINQLYDQVASETFLGQTITTTDTTGGKQTTTDTQSIGNKQVARTVFATSDEKNYSYLLTEEKTKIKVDVNFLCNKLKDNKVLIILEDYHLVDSSFNKTLSEDLKHFLDDEILFVLIGIPSSPKRALRNNPDLSGRLEHLVFDYLTTNEIKQIIKLGTDKLNVFLSEDIIEEIIKSSMNNAFLVQYICKLLLSSNNVNETQKKQKRIIDKLEVGIACKTLADKLDNDYKDIYGIINAGIRKQQENKAFNQYEEILKVLKHYEIEELEKGIHYTDIYKWSWQNIDPDIVVKFIKNETYKNESSFKNSFRKQIKDAVENINANLSKNSSRPVLYVDEGKIYLTDLVFKFYINWKNEA
ncbi:hypothetical protein [Tenacibaculum finnmarkense]|uniref:hypothetical protein n=1 Tax=Tenacibaculum finnmarkense TaxID=2781243 RepID=UPI001EFB1C8D|nr:hypothetical protein [Tenacibaculum finnmarkense]MCG8860044.1 hypothetical protein [Tenacibaculum finnmarkense]